MMDKYFKVSIFFFSLKATFSFFKKKKDVILSLSILLTFYVICCIIGFNHVRQIQNKSELKIFKMMNT